MYLMKAELSYGSLDDAVKKSLTRDQWEEARRAAPGIDLPDWETVDPNREWKEGEYGKWWSAEGLITITELEALSRVGLKASVSRVRGLFSEASPGAVLADAQRAGTVNIDISVPGGVALMSLRSVTWLEDCCTQLLQSYLNLGWRMVAVCPPNDTRRPTYIIGHQEQPGPTP
jgi:hypothetical protein